MATANRVETEVVVTARTDGVREMTVDLKSDHSGPIADHTHRRSIELACAAGASPSEVAARFFVDEATVRQHWSGVTPAERRQMAEEGAALAEEPDETWSW